TNDLADITPWQRHFEALAFGAHKGELLFRAWSHHNFPVVIAELIPIAGGKNSGDVVRGTIDKLHGPCRQTVSLGEASRRFLGELLRGGHEVRGGALA